MAIKPPYFLLSTVICCLLSRYATSATDHDISRQKSVLRAAQTGALKCLGLRNFCLAPFSNLYRLLYERKELQTACVCIGVIRADSILMIGSTQPPVQDTHDLCMSVTGTAQTR